MRHGENCEIYDDGPCTCGAEEAWDDEVRDEIQRDIDAEEAPNDREI